MPDGRIWSRALWDIRSAIGNVRADTTILEGQFDFAGTTMTDLAKLTVAAAQRLYGNATANSVRAGIHGARNPEPVVGRSTWPSGSSAEPLGQVPGHV